MTNARLEWHGERAEQLVDAAAVRGLGIGAEHLLGVSRQQVPLEEATLERSGATSVDAGSFTASVSYDTPYAARQHEELTWRHDPGRKAKYLEDPHHSEAQVVGELIATTIRRTLRG